ncbi:MAG: hypothetical protein C4519_16310 [Desulfobacteraceae bacterium]|nr:MAG: hypothetical protein C4519_16310 [Desulfobacteraceae bacterium]
MLVSFLMFGHAFGPKLNGVAFSEISCYGAFTNSVSTYLLAVIISTVRWAPPPAPHHPAPLNVLHSNVQPLWSIHQHGCWQNI